MDKSKTPSDSTKEKNVQFTALNNDQQQKVTLDSAPIPVV